MKNQLLRIIVLTAILSLVLFSWLKSKSDANVDYETKVRTHAPQEQASSQISIEPFATRNRGVKYFV